MSAPGQSVGVMKPPKRKRSSKTAAASVATHSVDAANVTAGVDMASVDMSSVDMASVAMTGVETSGLEVANEAPIAVDLKIVLAAHCSVKDAAALKTSLSVVSQASDAVTLDVGAVERIDTATMQLLCAFARDRAGRQQSVTWTGESQALQDAARLLGVHALLGFEDAKGVAA